jgi:hypothetical protein
MKKLIPVLLFILLVGDAIGQYRWDVGVSVGGANYLGDIGGREKTRRDFVMDMHLDQTSFVVGAFGRYRLTKGTSLSGGINYGRIQGADSNSENPPRVARNMTFRNDILELNARAEFTLFYDNDVGGKGYYNPDFKLFAFVGLAGFYHNPKTKHYDDYVALRPYTTEGVEYSRFQFAIPMGLGLFFTHKKIHRFGWELGYRFTFTDYLDDISTVYPRDDQLSGDLQTARELAFRTTPELIEQVNAEARQRGFQEVNYESFSQPGQKRGDATNNDGYMFMQFSYSRVIKGQSTYYKRRYSWVDRKRASNRRTRAKF